MALEPVTAIAEAINSLSLTFNTFLEKLPVFKDMKRVSKLEKAINIANKALDLVSESKGYLSNKELKQFKEYKEDFDNCLI